MQPEAFADAVVVLVKNAMGPVLERLAAAEARLAVLGDVRDRMVVMETKTAMLPPLVERVTPEPVDVSPILERVAVLESKHESSREDFEEFLGAAKAADELLLPRVYALEQRQGIPGPAGERGPEGPAGFNGLAGAQGLPGEKGADGLVGKDGVNGKDGVDGLGWDDLAVSQVDERTFTVKCLKGLQVKELGTLTFPVEIYRGVYLEGKSYDRGDGVTWGGSEWHCNDTTTTKPGDGSKAWTLKVKRGRDGRDGKDAMMAPVVSIGKR